MKDILAYISTRGRTNTTLPLALFAIINQTKKPDHLIIFDDNDEKVDIRENQIYKNALMLLEQKGISWQVIFGECKGQHYNHQIANTFGFKWCWRVDDDCIPESNVLENLYNTTIMIPDVGAVGGSVIVPTWINNQTDKIHASNNINEIYKPNKQWFIIDQIEQVDHLHCTFLYRAGIVNYNLNLSKVAHREETLFTYELHKKGYKNYIIPDAITIHLKYDNGGIRQENSELYQHDENIFLKLLDSGYIVYLDNGIGDHIVFSSLLDDIIKKHEKITVACCYPEVFEDWKNKINIVPIDYINSIINPIDYNIYKLMWDWQWNDTLQNAFRKLYL